MLCRSTSKLVSWAMLMVLFILCTSEAYASHAQGVDLTYQCLGGNQYQFTLKFYRDCAGVNAPNNATINCSSISCSQNFNLTLNPIPNTGIEVTPICPTQSTTCTNGNFPGVREYIYTGVTNLMPCNDWVFSFSLCCRNAAITTINNPGGENIYVEATLNNLNFPCNSSPTFTNRPVPYVCVNQNFCFNHGASDPDGDMLLYSLVTPATGPNTTVTYLNPYTATQPLASTPPVSFNAQTGDICMYPTMLEVTVMAVRVTEWRNNQLVGSVTRDIQVQTTTCSNINPSINGINGTGLFTMNVCAGQQISFFTNSTDPDPNQTVTMTWNNGIPNGNFSITGSPYPTGTFTWTPTTGDAGPAPHCFTVTVADDNCPYFGSQTYSFCIYVSAPVITLTGSNGTCGSPSASASVTVSGSPPFTYLWSTGATTNFISGLITGTYTVTVTDANGCTNSGTISVIQPSPPVLATTQQNVSCFGGNNGSATVTVTNGNGPYTYSWTSGSSTSSATGLNANNYFVTVTDVNGCTSVINVQITQPAQLQTSLSAFNDVTCFGDTNGSATVLVVGGTPPYAYLWNTTPPQIYQTASNLGAGTYQVNVTDANNCTSTLQVAINQPQQVTGAPATTPVSCYGGNNGSATVIASGGTGPYAYSWNTTPQQFTQTVNNLPSGNYIVTITDTYGCTGTANANVSQPAPLVANVIGVMNVSCFGGNNGSATGSGTGGTGPYNYSWNTVPVQTSVQATGLAAGSYTLTVTDINGCAAVSTVNITQPAQLNTLATGTDTICPGQIVQVSATSTGGNGGYTYLWSQGLGFGQTHNVNPFTTTIYTVMTTDAQGCTAGPDTVIIYVYEINSGNVAVNNSGNICYGQLSSVSASVSGFTGPVNYVWSNNLGFGPGPITVYPTSTTTYTVTVTNSCGASVSATTTVVVFPLPQITLSPVNGVGCDYVTISFTDTSSSNSGCTYFWDFGDGYTTVAQNPVHNYTTTGVYQVTVTITSPFGCTSSASTWCTVAVNPSPTASFTADLPVATNLWPTITFTDHSTNTNNWFWDFGDGNTSTLQHPVHTYGSTGTFTVMLIATNAAGCIDTFIYIVRVDPEFTFYIPNAFTPNGDGVNETFKGEGAEIIEFNMQIFDRWGAMIFQTNNLYKGWDGHANGGDEIAQEDVYVYKVVLKDFSRKQHVYTGHVSLIR